MRVLVSQRAVYDLVDGRESLTYDAPRTVHMHLPQIRREVDAGCVMHGQLEDGYPHEYYERDGSEVVEEPLPPAYEDLPPRGRPGGSIPANRV